MAILWCGSSLLNTGSMYQLKMNWKCLLGVLRCQLSCTISSLDSSSGVEEAIAAAVFRGSRCRICMWGITLGLHLESPPDWDIPTEIVKTIVCGPIPKVPQELTTDYQKMCSVLPVANTGTKTCFRSYRDSGLESLPKSAAAFGGRICFDNLAVLLPRDPNEFLIIV